MVSSFVLYGFFFFFCVCLLCILVRFSYLVCFPLCDSLFSMCNWDACKLFHIESAKKTHSDHNNWSLCTLENKIHKYKCTHTTTALHYTNAEKILLNRSCLVSLLLYWYQWRSITWTFSIGTKAGENKIAHVFRTIPHLFSLFWFWGEHMHTQFDWTKSTLCL